MFFKKKTSSLKAYCDGRMISIEKVNDEVFSQKMMGDGVAIQPVNGKLTSPCDGTVSMIFEQTGHFVYNPSGTFILLLSRLLILFLWIFFLNKPFICI